MQYGLLASTLKITPAQFLESRNEQMADSTTTELLSLPAMLLTIGAAASL